MKASIVIAFGVTLICLFAATALAIHSEQRAPQWGHHP